MSRSYALIPVSTLESLLRWAHGGMRPGDAVSSLLRNELFGWVSRCDEENEAATRAILMLVHNDLPFDCWGNRSLVDAWADRIHYPLIDLTDGGALAAVNRARLSAGLPELAWAEKSMSLFEVEVTA